MSIVKKMGGGEWPPSPPDATCFGGGVHIYIYSVHRTERYTNMLIVKILYVYFDNSTKYKST